MFRLISTQALMNTIIYNFHSTVIVLRGIYGCITVQWIQCIYRWIQRSVRIKQLQ